MRIFKPIFISLSPNVQKDDFWLALKLVFTPWSWKKTKASERLEQELGNYLKIAHCFAFNSGRSALLAILKALDLREGSEILVQGFTCNAAVNPIIWSGFKPVYVDIEKETLNIDPKDLEKKITSEAKAVLVQHTFGLPAKMDEILAICKKHNLILIEDCAHALGAEYKGKKVGAFGQAAFFSMGRDKIISSVYGGMAVTNDPGLAERVQSFQQNLDFPSGRWTLQQLLHPVLTKGLVMPLYGFCGLGKYILIIFQRLKLMSKAVHKTEKKGRQPRYFPQKMPNALSVLALNQFKKLEDYNKHRQNIADVYQKELQALGHILPPAEQGRIFMRYSLLTEDNTDKLIDVFKKKRIFLNDGWRKSVIMPFDTSQEAMQYHKGACPVAEKAAEQIINLPTHINIKKADTYSIVKDLKP